MIESRLQEVHFRLKQIALRLGDEEARRESHFVPPLFDVEALTGHGRAGARGADALGGAVHLADRLT